jgi:tRNA modification GTPase
MSVTQAEAVADLIAAANTGAVDLALEKLSGSQNRLLTELAEELRQLATLGEVGIDFADQDIEEVGLPRLKQRASVLVEKLRRLGDSFQRGSRLQDGVPVAFVGLPNAGKSSFFNALLGEDRSIVSEVAGTTRDLVRERLTLQGPYGNVTLRLEDTAGLRASGDLVESMGIARSRKAASNADLLILVVDASSLDSRSLEDLTGEWRQLGSPSAKTLGILAKKDRVSAAELEGAVLRLQSLGLSHWHGVSSLSGEGVAEAGSAIAEACQSWVRREAGEVLLTRFDQLEAVRAAVAHLERALAAMELDLFASDLRQALLVLSSLIGDTLPDDILGRVFSQFCIGK